RPVIAQSIASLRTKIDRSKSQRDAPPVIRSSADDARTEPLKIISGRGDIGLAFNLPGAIRREKLAEVLGLFSANADAAMRQIVWPHHHFVVFFRMKLWSRLEQHDVHAAFGANFGCHAAACARTDNANIVRFRR